MSACWVAVASAAHVRRGRAGGFMQLGHGKRAPLGRVRPGDRIAYYSPTVTMGGTDRLRAFTAIGTVRAGEPYAVAAGDDVMYRRDVDWDDAGEAPIEPLLPRLELTAGAASWGYRLRFGLVAVSAHDLALIADAMAAARETRSTATAPRRR